jgi:membrane protein DedA with SNARE-associated domain
MSDLENLLRDYGLWALFLAAAFEGDLTLLTAGVLIHLEIWPAPRALAVGAAGGLAGDLFYFWLGHGTARRWLTTAHGERLRPRLERAAKRFGLGSLFIARYIYGARVATMFFWGMRRLPAWKFVLIDAANCLQWALVLTTLGYVFANGFERLVGELRLVEHWLLVAFVVFGALLALRHFWAERSRARSEEQERP